jgi:hypothetical protein
MDGIRILEGAMTLPGTATRGGAAAGTLPLVFVSADGRAPEALPGGFAATVVSETIFLTELACGGRTFLFARPLPVQVLQEEGGCSFESEEYSLLAYGRDRREAESSFRHVFVRYWDQIACAGDEKLTQGAVALKRALRALVKPQE